MSKDEEQTIADYVEAYGPTVSFATAPEGVLSKIVVEMRRCLKGQRGPLTDEEFFGGISDERKL